MVTQLRFASDISGADASFNNIDINGYLNVTGKTTIKDISSSHASFTSVDISGDLIVKGKVIKKDELHVIGDISANENIIVGGELTASSGKFTDLTVSNDLTVSDISATHINSDTINANKAEFDNILLFGNILKNGENISDLSNLVSRYQTRNIISTGNNHTVVLLNTGEVMTVGNNSDGQLGDGTNTSKSKLVSMDASGNYDKTNAVAISTGIKHTVVLLNTGEVMTVGNNQFGQLGDGTSGTGTNKTQLVSMDASGNYDTTNAVAISCGYYHTVVLLNTGEVMTIGNNYDGQLGDGTTTNKTQLVSMDASGNYDKTNAVAISCGSFHTVVLLNTGEVMTVGNNYYGQRRWNYN